MKRNPFTNLFKVDESYWLLVLPVLYATIPWFQYRVRALIPFAFAMLWLMPKIPSIAKKMHTYEGRAFFKVLLWYVLLVFIQELFAVFGSQKHMKYYQIATITTSVIFFLVAFYTIAYHKFSELRFLTVVTIGGFILAGMMAFRGLGVVGMESARVMMSLQDSMNSQVPNAAAKAVIEYGLGGYSHVYNCAWLAGIAMLAFVISKDTRLKVFYVLLAVSTIISVKVGGLATPFGIVVIEAMIFLIWLKTRSRKVILISGYIIVILFFLYANTPQVFSFLIKPLNSLAQNMSDGSIKLRVVSVVESFNGEVSYADTRAQMQLKSFRTFCRHPFFGTFGPFTGGSQLDLGGHSYLLDLLGGYGLFGLFVFAMFMGAMLKYFSVLGDLYLGSKWLVIPVFFMSVFLFSSIMNPVTFFANSVYLLPGIAYLSELHTELPMVARELPIVEVK